MNWNCEKASIAHSMTVLTIDWLFVKSRKHLSAKCLKRDLAANIQTCPLLVHKPATIKAGRNFGFYEQVLVHFMYCVPRLGWALRPLQSASHARIPSMKSGCFSSNLSNACPQICNHKAGRNFGFYEQVLVHFMYCVPRLGWALRPLQSASHARIPSMKSGCFSSNLSNACPQALLHSLEARAPGRRGVRLKARA